MTLYLAGCLTVVMLFWLGRALANIALEWPLDSTDDYDNECGGVSRRPRYRNRWDLLIKSLTWNF